MVYITGDTHGDFDRFKSKTAKKIKKQDTLIVLGDFGFVWDNSKKEEKTLDKLSKFKYTIAFLDGPHENFDLLNSYPLVNWNKGKARQIRDNIFYLQRGEIYNIEYENYFTFGGGQSENFDLNTIDKDMYRKALPSLEEMKNGADNLYNHDHEVDFILTHEPSFSSGGQVFENNGIPNGIYAYLNQIEKNVKYKKWFFGSLHIDKRVSKRHTAVYRELIPVHNPKKTKELKKLQKKTAKENRRKKKR